ncbi:MAG: hypothetical protein Q4A65_05230 [Bacillota bacterium]|nr:hypothetical protein [Bacillota bacterium]
MILPLVILAVISLAYFIRIESVWENIMYDALDESTYSASRAYGSPTELDSIPKIKRRINQENTGLSYLKITGVLDRYTDRYADQLTCYTVKAGMNIHLPAGFSRSLDFKGRVKYRGFKGLRYESAGMGTEGLESDVPEDPVWIFPQSGERYHIESCTYVKATVKGYILTPALKRKYHDCEMCHSEELPAGALVFCFTGEDTAYHRGNCRSIKRHYSVINRSEAKEKGYTPCSKCGGGESL